MILRNLILVVGLFYCEALVADCFRDGRKAIEYRDFDAAIEHFTACIDQRHLPEGKRVSSFIYRGISYHEQGRDTLAIQDYTSAIKLNRDYAVAYNNRGIAYKSQGKLDLAIQDYTKAIRLDPSSIKYFPMDFPSPVPPPVMRKVLSANVPSFSIPVKFIFNSCYITCMKLKIKDRFLGYNLT